MAQNLFEPNPLKSLPRASYSTDICPSDFYLFEKGKRALIGREIPDEIALREAVTDILNGIPGAELQGIFRNQTDGVERVIDAIGDYFTWEIYSSLLSRPRSTPLWRV
jgi:hypothetical protein